MLCAEDSGTPSSAPITSTGGTRAGFLRTCIVRSRAVRAGFLRTCIVRSRAVRAGSMSRSHYLICPRAAVPAFPGSVSDVPILTRELFDTIESDAASTGDYAVAAQLMSELAATGTQTAEMSRAEAFLRAGEQWLLADSPERAAEGFRRAIEVGGPVSVDPRVPLARALLQLDRADQAQELLSQVQAEGPVDPRTCDLLAELLAEQSDLRGALGWATAGVELCLNARQRGDVAVDGDDRELRMLLRLRYRIRNDLGLPEDEYDALLDET
jgi:hypothetical protein